MVNQIDETYHISEKENNTYKIAHKDAIAIIKKINSTLLLITAYGFEKYDYKIRNKDFKVSVAVPKKKRKQSKEEFKGIIHKIYRINGLNEQVECGTISDISKSQYLKDQEYVNEFKYKIVLHWRLFLKFKNIPMKPYDLYFNNFNEISGIVHLENDVFMLNDFKRTHQ